ncbi:MAG: hypothetical protein ACE5E5_00305 [Phycisphaerae bacterium]
MTDTLESLRQHQLVILRRLRRGPLTEFELAGEVADVSGYTTSDASDRMEDWLEELCNAGLIWYGQLRNSDCQTLLAAALTSRGKELVG